MSINEQPHIFEDRTEAGRRLAKRLMAHKTQDTIVLGIARGGVPVAAAAAARLLLPWNVVVTLRLPLPWCPESGFGAVASDGSVVINEAILSGIGLDQHYIDRLCEAIAADAKSQAELYAAYRVPLDVQDRPVILVDDALMSGYTMTAAIKYLRAHHASNVIASAPVASRSAASLVEGAADECIFEAISPSLPFSPLDFYFQYPELKDADIFPLLCPKCSAG